MELKDELSALQNDLKSYVQKAAEEKTQFGTMLAETKAIQKQIDAVDVKLAQKSVAEPEKSFSESLKENEDVARLLKNRSGRASIT